MKKVIFFSFYLLSPLMMIRILYSMNPLKYSNSSVLMAMCMGVAAYHWFVWQFVLSARPKFLDKIIGLDKIYRLHGTMALVSIGLALGHNMIFEDLFRESLMTFLGGLSIGVYGGVSVVSVLVVTKSKWLRLKVISSMAKRIGHMKVLKYEGLKKFHNLSFLGLIFMQVHVLMTSSARMYPLVYKMYMIYFVTAIAFYLYHKIMRPWIVEENKWKVEEVNVLSNNVYDIQMSSETHGMKYKPGQFGFFKMKVKDDYEVHPFSFSSSPGHKGRLSIAVKALGDFTSQLHGLSKGDEVYIDGPYGDFSYLNNPHEEKTFFIAGGVGITPVLSMIRFMSLVEPDRNVTLLWGIRKEEDYLFKEEFDSLMEKMPNLKVIPVLSDAIDYEGERGYINYNLLLKYVEPGKYKNKHVGYYICGPQILMKNSRKHLYELGISGERIHYESFSF